MQKENKCKK